MYFAAMSGKFNRKKFFIILIHVICWALLFALPWMLKPDRPMQEAKMPAREMWDKNMWAIIFLGITLRVLWVAIFYVNANIIVPRLVYKGRYRDYILSLLAILISFFALDALFIKINVLQSFTPDIHISGEPYLPHNT
jgi:hypothetical protein